MSTPSILKGAGTGYRQVTSPTRSPEQMDLFRQLLSGSGGNIQSILQQLQGLSGGGDEDYWQQLEAPAMRQFGKLQGDVASRFSGMGTGARKSSGFQNALAGASTDLSERLQAQRLGLQGQARNQLLDLYGSLLGQNMFQTNFVPNQQKSPSFLKQILGSLAPNLGKELGGGIGSLLGIF